LGRVRMNRDGFPFKIEGKIGPGLVPPLTKCRVADECLRHLLPAIRESL